VHSEERLEVAKRIFWFGTPEEALEFPLRTLPQFLDSTAGKWPRQGSLFDLCPWADVRGSHR